MNLPNISTPTYEVKLFSQDKPVKFRPFLVKEQKLMLMAAEAKTSEDTANIVKQIAQNCLIDNINVDELPLVDLELLFLNFRARSIGENIITYFKCKNKNSSQEECGMVIELPINLLEVPVVNADVQKKIMITDNVGVQMKYPTFEAVTLLSSEKFNDDPDAEFKAAAMNIDYVFDENGIYKSKDVKLEDLLNFIYSMPPDRYKKIEEFFNNLPTVRKEIDHDCPKCKFKHHFVLEGLNDFFI
jgi:T4 bacteriophage base plate protein